MRSGNKGLYEVLFISSLLLPVSNLYLIPSQSKMRLTYDLYPKIDSSVIPSNVNILFLKD